MLYFDDDFSGPSPDEIKALLEAGDPGIFVGGGGSKKEISIVMVNVQDGEEIIIAERLNEILRS